MVRILVVVLAWNGCAGGGGDPAGDAEALPPPVARGDAGDGGDGGPFDAAVRCDDGEHACPDGCEPDQPNEPLAGCRLSCGRACEVPEDGEAFCDTGGRCAIRCSPPYDVVDGRC